MPDAEPSFVWEFPAVEAMPNLNRVSNSIEGGGVERYVKFPQPLKKSPLKIEQVIMNTPPIGEVHLLNMAGTSEVRSILYAP